MAPQKRKAPAAPASVAESAKSSKSTKSAPAVGTRSSARLRGLAPVETVAPPAKPKAQSVAGGTTGSQPAKKSKPSPKEDPADSVSIAVGDVVPDLQTLGSAITSVTAADHDESKAGKKIKPEDEPEAPPGKTLNQLLQESDKGVVLFTYPKASTPGCTTQVNLFEPLFARLTKAGYSLYGLSADSRRANASFAAKQNLTYPLLCDPDRSVIAPLGLKKEVGGGTQRGVVAIGKDGKVLVYVKGGPKETADAIESLDGMAS